MTGPDVRGPAVDLRFDRAGGKSVHWRSSSGSPRPALPGVPFHFPRPVPGSARVEARAPDPAGGAPWGIVVADIRGGGTCAGEPVQLLGDRVGGIDPVLGLFAERPSEPSECRPRETSPTLARPLDLGTGFGQDPEEESTDPVRMRARIERRLQPGRLSIYAEAQPDVLRVTIRTPRDVRTLVPSARGHVLFALYDGDFPAGDIVVTAYLKNGRTWSQRMPAGI